MEFCSTKKATKPAATKKPKEPESLKKAKLTHDEVRAKRVKTVLALKKKRKQRTQEIFKRAQKYAREYSAAERTAIREKRAAKRGGNFYVEAEPKLAFVIRIRGINGIHPRPRKVSN